MREIIDGKRLAEALITKLSEERKAIEGEIRLAAVLVGDDQSSIHYLRQKAKTAAKIGVQFEMIQLPSMISTAAVKERIINICREQANTGVIVQLPLPQNIETSTVLDAVPKEKDVDVLSEISFASFIDGHSKILPPVVGAIEHILDACRIDPKGKFAVVVGSGRLVGIPSLVWFSHQGSVVCLVGKHSSDFPYYTKQADILVLGSGNPRSVTGEMVKDGAVVLDAAYEVVEGKAVGDADFESVLPKASFITPVPGGIGPLTVAILMRNLLTLAKLQRRIS